MKRLYLDVDGVLLGQFQGNVVLAPHAMAFIDFALAHFDVHWLTTHCRGDARTVLDYLRPFTSPILLDRIRKIKSTTQLPLTPPLCGGQTPANAGANGR